MKSFFLERVRAGLEATAQRHPLGFFLISERIHDNFVLRYHIWTENWVIPVGQESGRIHDHCYELNSLVIAGSLNQRTFNVHVSNNGAHDIFEVHYRTMNSGLFPTGLRAHIELEYDETFDVGTAYRLPAGVIHCADPLKAPTATLVLAISIPGALPPRVLVEIGQDPPGEFNRAPLDLEEISLLKQAILKMNLAE
jgi:hypothetical protein